VLHYALFIPSLIQLQEQSHTTLSTSLESSTELLSMLDAQCSIQPVGHQDMTKMDKDERDAPNQQGAEACTNLLLVWFWSYWTHVRV